MSRGGYIKYYRSLVNHEILTDPLEQYNWLKLIAAASWQDTTQRIPNTTMVVPVKRGQYLTSERGLMSLWGCGNTKARNLLDLLVNEGMVVSEAKHRKRLLTICNYEIFQGDKAEPKATDKPEPNANPTRTQPNKEEILITLRKIEEIKRARGDDFQKDDLKGIKNPCPELIEQSSWLVELEFGIADFKLVEIMKSQGWATEEMAA